MSFDKKMLSRDSMLRILKGRFCLFNSGELHIAETFGLACVRVENQVHLHDFAEDREVVVQLGFGGGGLDSSEVEFFAPLDRHITRQLFVLLNGSVDVDEPALDKVLFVAYNPLEGGSARSFDEAESFGRLCGKPGLLVFES